MLGSGTYNGGVNGNTDPNNPSSYAGSIATRVLNRQAEIDAPYTSFGGVNPEGGDANDIAARLIRSQYANWQKNFQPIEIQALMQSSLNNPNVLSNAVDTATTRATGTADTMAGVEQRQLSGLGIAPTEQQSAVSTRVRNLSRAGIVAGAQNSARSNVAATDEMIALGGIPSVAA